MSDIVAELEEHIRDAERSADYVIEWRRPLLVAFLTRARDEIVALRKGLLTQYGDAEIIAKAKNEALEEAARRCDAIAEQDRQRCSHWDANASDCAAAIRALKEKE